MTQDQTDDTDPRTVVSRFLDSLTFGQVAMYIRIGLYAISGALLNGGVLSPDAAWLEPAIGAATFGGTLAWTIWGHSITNRIKALMATGQIDNIVSKTRAVAASVPDDRVTATADTSVTSR